MIKLTAKLARELAKAFRNHKYERTESGVLFTESKVRTRGDWTVSVNGGPAELSHNLITTQGLNHMLDTELHGGTQVTTWYVAPFDQNSTPLAAWTPTDFASIECEEYDESARVPFVEAAASGGSTTNSASKAVFTFNASKTIYGAGLLSVSTKGSTTGTLFAAVRFATSKTVADDDVINVGYTVTLTSS